MGVYYFIYTACFLTMFADRPSIALKTKKYLMTGIVVVLTLFFGLRWECGTDWEQYYQIFQVVEWTNFFSLNRYGEQNVEVGFAFANVLLKTIGLGSYTFYLLVTNLIRFWLMAYVSFRLSKYPIISFFGFLSLQYMFPTRNPYATAIYFVGFIFIMNRDLKRYVLNWLTACAVHISSLLVFPIYFLYGIRLKFFYQLLFYVGTIVFANMFNELLQQIGLLISFGSGTIDEKLGVYTQAFREVENTRGLVSMALPLFFLSLFEWVRCKPKFTKKECKDFDFMIVCYLIATGIWNVLANTMPDLCRYVEFINTWPLLMSFVMSKFRNYFYPIVVLLVLYYLYRMNNTINLGIYHDLFVPYRSIFS